MEDLIQQGDWTCSKKTDVAEDRRESITVVVGGKAAAFAAGHGAVPAGIRGFRGVRAIMRSRTFAEFTPVKNGRRAGK